MGQDVAMAHKAEHLTTINFKMVFDNVRFQKPGKP